MAEQSNEIQRASSPRLHHNQEEKQTAIEAYNPCENIERGSSGSKANPSRLVKWAGTVRRHVKNYMSFVGPGFLISIAFMDPGNYSTDVSAGAEKKFALLFIILLSNIMAVFLQCLAIKLGSVTGLDYAAVCRKYYPKWARWTMYFFSEIALLLTDVAEVIGAAIALNVLIRVPLMAGVALTILDTLLILMIYRSQRGLQAARQFEIVMTLFVLAVIILFIIELTKIPDQNVGEVFRGFLPSNEVISGNGMYLSCGILGATIMPHSLFLGSSIVLPRLKEYDGKGSMCEDESVNEEKYQPSYDAIKYTLPYAYTEVGLSLSSFAMFVNCSILVVAGSTMYQYAGADDADLYGIRDLLSNLIAPIAGTIFMLALLFSGLSASIICTITGQIVFEGFVQWTIKPYIRRFLTRAITVTPCLIVVGVLGKDGLNQALNASQVGLSILLPIISGPLVFLTNSKRVMTIDNGVETIDMSNGWITKILGILVWLFLCILNVYLLVQVGMGNS